MNETLDNLMLSSVFMVWSMSGLNRHAPSKKRLYTNVYKRFPFTNIVTISFVKARLTIILTLSTEKENKFPLRYEFFNGSILYSSIK